MVSIFMWKKFEGYLCCRILDIYKHSVEQLKMLANSFFQWWSFRQKFFVICEPLVFRRETCCCGWMRPVWTVWPTPRPWPPSRPPSASAASHWSSWRSVSSSQREFLSPRRNFRNWTGQKLDWTICQGPETSFGASNFIPSWMFWQKLPRQLQYPKTVILHRRDGTSWGFSIVGEFNHQTENMYRARSCWGSVKRNTQCTFLFAHKRILKTLTYILFLTRNLSMSLQK